MDKKELVEKLRSLQHTYGDQEDSHLKADALLLEYIDDEHVKDAYDAIHKWYS